MSDSLTHSRQVTASRRRGESDVVHPFPYGGDDRQLVNGLLNGNPAAAVHLYVTFAERVRRLLYRILGPDSELEDTLHDTFVRALESVHGIRDPNALRSWIAGVAIRTARIRIQRRQRRRWLTLFAPEDIPETTFIDTPAEVSEALQAVARVLGQLEVEERIAVVLRLAENMTMPEAAEACGVSLSTFKRRLQRGELRFRELVSREPSLADWCQGDADGP